MRVRISALAIRPLRVPAIAGDTVRWAGTVGEAELLIRQIAGGLPPDGVPHLFRLSVFFARGAPREAQIALCREDAYREASPWEAVLLHWAKEEVDAGDVGRTLCLSRMAELVRHVAHQRAVGEFVDVYEHLDDLDEALDPAGLARRRRVLGSPQPTPLRGARHRDGQPLARVARDVRRDIETALVAGLLPEGLGCDVRIEPYEGGPGIEIEVVRAPGLWIPDLCEMCVPAAWGVEPPPEGGLTCGHTPTLAGHSRQAHGVLLTLLAIGDVYNRDSSQIEHGQYRVESAFELATCFDGCLGRAQRETLRSSEEAMRALRRRAETATPASPSRLPAGPSLAPVEPPRRAR